MIHARVVVVRSTSAAAAVKRDDYLLVMNRSLQRLSRRRFGGGGNINTSPNPLPVRGGEGEPLAASDWTYFHSLASLTFCRKSPSYAARQFALSQVAVLETPDCVSRSQQLDAAVTIATWTSRSFTICSTFETSRSSRTLIMARPRWWIVS